jgi:uncharacterized repeat protein (TIGR01451 family)
MTEQFRRDLHAALDSAAGPGPSPDRVLAGVRTAPQRPRFGAAVPWAVGALTAAALAGVLTAPRLMGSQHPTGRPAPAVVQTTAQPSATLGQVTPLASPSVTASQAPTPAPSPTVRVSSKPSPAAPVAETSPTPAPACTASEVLVAVTTDQSTYAPGQTVHFTLTARNVSNHACQLPGSHSVYVVDSSGHAVSLEETVEDQVAAGATWAPGQTLTDSSLGWDQRECLDTTCSQRQQVPSGTYTVKGTYGQYGPASHSFTIG